MNKKIQVRSMLDDVRSVNKISAAPDRTGTARLLGLLALVTRFDKKRVIYNKFIFISKNLKFPKI